MRDLPTHSLTEPELIAIRALMDAAFGTDEEDGFADEDWAHALGGRHFVLESDGAVVSHASVVERVLEVGGRPLRTGYVEAVATAPGLEGRGHGSAVMAAANGHIRATYELGALGTGRHAFYERLGWETWRGEAFVRTPNGLVRTPEDEGFILVLRTPLSPLFSLSESICCDWRPGDVWWARRRPGTLRRDERAPRPGSTGCLGRDGPPAERLIGPFHYQRRRKGRDGRMPLLPWKARAACRPA